VRICGAGGWEPLRLPGECEGEWDVQRFRNDGTGERELVGMRAKVARRLGLATVLSVACYGWLLGATASATVAQFGASGEGAGQFVEPHGIAVDQNTGDAYVADTNNQRIDSFGREGDFRYAIGWGVRTGASELQVCTTETGCRAGIEGGGAGQFSFAEGVAVDNDPASASYGDLYVLDSRNARVQKFDSAGHFLLMFGGNVNAKGGDVCVSGESCVAGTGPGLGEGEFSVIQTAIAVGATGEVYVGDYNRVQRFTASGQYVSSIALGEVGLVRYVAVSSTGTVYVTAFFLSGVHTYDSFGNEIGTPIDSEGEPRDLALGPHDELFVVNAQPLESQQPGIVEYAAGGEEVASFGTGTHGEDRGIAFGNTIERLYVVSGTPDVRVLPLPPAGPLVVEGSESVSEVAPTKATLQALVDPEGSAVEYYFDYGVDESYGTTTATVPLASTSLFENASATAEAVNLSPNTLYHFRVVARDAGGHTTIGPDATFTTLPPLFIESESVSDVTPDSARLRATINPLGTQTEYRFEYGTSTAYEASVPVPDASVGAGKQGAAVETVLEHLHPETQYHYRVVAHNQLGEVQGADRTFTTMGGGAFALADNRDWELVSPPSKGGAALESLPEEGGLIQAAEDGSAFTYVALAPVSEEAPGNRSPMFTQLMSRRGAQGWETENITTPREVPIGAFVGFRGEYPLFSDDLSKGLLEPPGTELLLGEATEHTPYLREGNAYRPVLTPGDVTSGEKFGGVEKGAGVFEGSAGVATATPDFSYLVVRSPVALTPGFTVAGGGLESLYLWHAGSLRLVSVLPNGHAAVEAGAQSLTGRGGRHAISQEGARVIFRTSREAENHLFVRDVGAGVTVQVDLPESGKSGQGRANFQDASADGRRILFTDSERLTSNASSESFTKADLYECELEGTGAGTHCDLTDLSVPRNAGEASDVVGDIAGVGESANQVYFVANGMLAPGAVPGNCPDELSGEIPAAAKCNLYMYDASAREVRLIAVLSGADFPDWAGINPRQLGELTARVSPSGQYLAFMSQRSLTGYDNRDSASGAPDEEVFLYDAAHGSLACVSCDPTGGRPKGVLDSGEFPRPMVDRPGTWSGRWIAASIPGWTRANVATALYQSRYLSNSGRLFFNAYDALVPQDVNGTADVYEYEPVGVGGCQKNSGCVALMSSGTAEREAAFLDASSDGSDVFFLTSSRLTPSDTDSEFDVYDAHVCDGACPAQPGNSTVPPCASAETCRSKAPLGIYAAPVPVTVGPGSSGFARAHATVRRLSREQLLSRALHMCRRKHGRSRRRCEALAHRRYGLNHTGRKTSRRK